MITPDDVLAAINRVMERCDVPLETEVITI